MNRVNDTFEYSIEAVEARNAEFVARTAEIAELKRMLELRETQLQECTTAMREVATELREWRDDRSAILDVERLSNQLMKVRYECGLNGWFENVLAFMKKYRQSVGTPPTVSKHAISYTLPSMEVVALRERLVAEEYQELMSAIRDCDVPEIADACVDLCYVVIGTAIAYGLDIRLVWHEVHAANMRKVMIGDPNTAKVSKPEGWVAPDIIGALKKGKPL